MKSINTKFHIEYELTSSDFIMDKLESVMDYYEMLSAGQGYKVLVYCASTMEVITCFTPTMQNKVGHANLHLKTELLYEVDVMLLGDVLTFYDMTVELQTGELSYDKVLKKAQAVAETILEKRDTIPLVVVTDYGFDKDPVVLTASIFGGTDEYGITRTPLKGLGEGTVENAIPIDGDMIEAIEAAKSPFDWSKKDPYEDSVRRIDGYVDDETVILNSYGNGRTNLPAIININHKVNHRYLVRFLSCKNIQLTAENSLASIGHSCVINQKDSKLNTIPVNVNLNNSHYTVIENINSKMISLEVSVMLSNISSKVATLKHSKMVFLESNISILNDPINVINTEFKYDIVKHTLIPELSLQAELPHDISDNVLPISISEEEVYLEGADVVNVIASANVLLKPSMDLANEHFTVVNTQSNLVRLEADMILITSESFKVSELVDSKLCKLEASVNLSNKHILTISQVDSHMVWLEPTFNLATSNYAIITQF